MAASGNVLLQVLTCAFFVAVTGNFTLNNAPLLNSDIACLDECQFFEDNQTIVIINITNPKQAVKGVAYYNTPIRMKDSATRKVASFETSFTFRQEPMNYSATTTPDQMRYFLRGDGFTFLMSNSSSWKSDRPGALASLVLTLVTTPEWLQ